MLRVASLFKAGLNRDSVSSNVVFEEFVWRSLIASPLIKPFLTGRVTRGKMRVLEGFSRLVIYFDIENGFFFESFSFVHCCV